MNDLLNKINQERERKTIREGFILYISQHMEGLFDQDHSKYRKIKQFQ